MKTGFAAGALLALVAVLISSAVAAQPPGPPPTPMPAGPPGGPGEDQGGMQQAILRHFYPLDMIRRHAGEIELTDEQIAKLRKAVTEGNTEVEQLKWDLATSARKLLELVEQGATKEQVYAQMDVVFKYENKLKKKHLGLLIVIRDVLTPRQRKALDEIKAKAEPGPPGHGPGPGRGPGRGAKDPWSDRR